MPRNVSVVIILSLRYMLIRHFALIYIALYIANIIYEMNAIPHARKYEQDLYGNMVSKIMFCDINTVYAKNCKKMHCYNVHNYYALFSLILLLFCFFLLIILKDAWI